MHPSRMALAPQVESAQARKSVPGRQTVSRGEGAPYPELGVVTDPVPLSTSHRPRVLQACALVITDL